MDTIKIKRKDGTKNSILSSLINTHMKSKTIRMIGDELGVSPNMIYLLSMEMQKDGYVKVTPTSDAIFVYIKTEGRFFINNGGYVSPSSLKSIRKVITANIKSIIIAIIIGAAGTIIGALVLHICFGIGA